MKTPNGDTENHPDTPRQALAVVTAAGTFLLPDGTTTWTADPSGTVHADGVTLQPVHCACPQHLPDTAVCSWCRREFNPAGRLGSDRRICSDDCEHTQNRARNTREQQRKQADYTTRKHAGEPVCTIPTTAGNPCCATPIIASDVCYHHADETLRQARLTGIVYGQMAVPADLFSELVRGRPHPHVIDAYRIHEISKARNELSRHPNPPTAP